MRSFEKGEGMASAGWNSVALDELESRMRERVREGCRGSKAERGVAECIGYWYYQLVACRTAAAAPPPERREP
jgi:hypothetical protein